MAHTAAMAPNDPLRLLDTAATLDNAPPHVQELCLGCIQYVQRATGVALDFSAETLPVLDHYLQTVRTDNEALQVLVAQAAGAYFGELVRRLFPARWHCPPEMYESWRLEFSPCFLHFNPVTMAWEAILGREVVEGGAGFAVSEHNVPALRAALDTLGAVPEDDFYRLTTRLEVLEAVLDRVLAADASRGAPGATYGAEYYRMTVDRAAPKPD